MRKMVNLSEDTYNRLESFRDKRESFNQAVDRLLKVWEGFHSLSQLVGGMHESAAYQEKQRIGAAAPIVEAAHLEKEVER